MRAKSFGQIMMVIGIFLSCLMFVFSEWMSDAGLIANIRYAVLYCSEYMAILSYYCDPDAWRVTLGQGLLLPLFLFFIGLLIAIGAVSDRYLSRFLSFIIPDDC